MKWFGGHPFALMCEISDQVERPVGEPCMRCDEPIGKDDDGFVVPRFKGGQDPIHWECQMRSIVGGVNHQKRLCICCGGDQPHDPPDMTRRQAALAACDYWTGKNRG